MWNLRIFGLMQANGHWITTQIHGNNTFVRDFLHAFWFSIYTFYMMKCLFFVGYFFLERHQQWPMLITVLLKKKKNRKRIHAELREMRRKHSPNNLEHCNGSMSFEFLYLLAQSSYVKEMPFHLCLKIFSSKNKHIFSHFFFMLNLSIFVRKKRYDMSICVINFQQKTTHYPNRS